MSKAIGNIAEQLAKDHLLCQGLNFVVQNYRCKQGEIDLIFKDKNCWIFIEVKNRKNTHFGHPTEWVTPSKQRKILRAAQHYCLYKRLPASTAMRFDVIGMINLNPSTITWLPNAFLGE